jgi:hypothetical protein
MLNSQITGHGSINGYAWMFAGLLMATIRWARESGKQPSDNDLAQRFRLYQPTGVRERSQ